MISVMSLRTLSRYILCSVHCVQPYMFQIFEENVYVYDYGSFYQISVISWLVSADVSCFLACGR